MLPISQCAFYARGCVAAAAGGNLRARVRHWQLWRLHLRTCRVGHRSTAISGELLVPFAEERNFASRGTSFELSRQPRTCEQCRRALVSSLRCTRACPALRLAHAPASRRTSCGAPALRLAPASSLGPCTRASPVLRLAYVPASRRTSCGAPALRLATVPASARDILGTSCFLRACGRRAAPSSGLLESSGCASGAAVLNGFGHSLRCEKVATKREQACMGAVEQTYSMLMQRVR